MLNHLKFIKTIFGLTLFAMVCATGCGGSDLPDYALLGDLRVLSMQVDDGSGKSEVLPGGTINVTTLISDLNGAGRTLTYAFEACSDPGVGYGAEATCANASDRVVGPSGTVTVGGTFTSPNYSGAGPSWTGVAIPATLLTSRSTIEQYNGVAYLVRFTVTVQATGAQVTSVKRVVVSSALKTAKNANPTMTAIQTGGVNVTTLPSEKAAFTPVFGAGAAETYAAYTTQGTQQAATETLTVTWFYTDGKFKRTRTEGTASNDFTPPSPVPTTHGVVLFGVVRDGRGGEAYLRLVL